MTAPIPGIAPTPVHSHPACDCTPPLGFEAFVCPRCERLCAPCFGCADDAPALCDDCWMWMEAPLALGAAGERSGV